MPFRPKQGGTTKRVEPSSLRQMGMEAFVFLQVAEKAVQSCSQLLALLNVPEAYAARFSFLAALPEGLVERLVSGGMS